MDNWEKQKHANIMAFLTGPEYRERKGVLESLCNVLKSTNVVWGLSCSTALFFTGICDEFNDLDIIIKLDDVEKFEEAFNKIGKIATFTPQKPGFISPYYKEGKIKNIHVDLVGDFTLNTFEKEYCCKADKDQMDYVTIEGNLTLPLISIEGNLLLYAMMEGWQARRRFKRKLCYDFLDQRGLKHPEIFEDALKNQNLPEQFKRLVNELLSKSKA